MARMLTAILTPLVLLGVGLGCTSTADYEDLERRNQLLGLEISNLIHERDGLRQELAQAKNDLTAAEQRYADTKSASDDRNNNELATVRERLAQAGERLAILQAELARVRDFIATGHVNDKNARAQVLQELGTPTPGLDKPTTH